MEKIKLANDTVLEVSSIELVRGVLKITTTDRTVEELAALFSDKSNTSFITLLTSSGIESGYKAGFTSFAGIHYDAEGAKTVELFQPADATEARISNAEAAAVLAKNTANTANDKAEEVEGQNTMLASTIDELLTVVIPSLMV